MKANEKEEVVEALRELTTSYTHMMLRFEQAMQLLGKHFDVHGLDFEPVILASHSSSNRYFSYDDLMDDIWGGTRSWAAIRSTMKVLRQRLRESDMHSVANSIDGSNRGHYGLMLDRLK